MHQWLDQKIKSEGDGKQFNHAGLLCVIRRHTTLKHLCGYVLVGQDHPLFGRSYMEDCYPELNVHGGITWTDKLPDDYSGLWAIGFDCAHGGDLVPTSELIGIILETYRDIAYVETELRTLAEQIAKIQQQGCM